MSATDPLQDYLKSLNPKKDQQQILFYGREYKLWRNGKYLGIATWTNDANVGDSFQTRRKDPDTGHQIVTVWVADKWELVIKS